MKNKVKNNRTPSNTVVAFLIETPVTLYIPLTAPVPDALSLHLQECYFSYFPAGQARGHVPDHGAPGAPCLHAGGLLPSGHVPGQPALPHRPAARRLRGTGAPESPLQHDRNLTAILHDVTTSQCLLTTHKRDSEVACVFVRACNGKLVKVIIYFVSLERHTITTSLHHVLFSL